MYRIVHVFLNKALGMQLVIKEALQLDNDCEDISDPQYMYSYL